MRARAAGLIPQGRVGGPLQHLAPIPGAQKDTARHAGLTRTAKHWSRMSCSEVIGLQSHFRTHPVTAALSIEARC